MSDGRTHAQWTRAANLLLILPAAGLVALEVDPLYGATIALGGVAGHLITPDADVPWRTYEEQRIYRTLGPLAGRLWQAYWAPYAILIPHRSWASHLPGLGTALRMMYLLWPLLWLWPELDIGQGIGMPLLCLWASWSFQDFVHLSLDGFKIF